MKERLAAHLEASGLIPPGVRVLAGYSGGADSTCLLHLLWALGYDVVAAHLHHGQRAEADRELEQCAAFCEQLNVPFVSRRVDVPQLARELQAGLEEAGRHARYEFFAQAAHQASAALIATAHTLDDLLETMLLNLVRGCGIAGLAGIPARRGAVVRPLLPFERAETRAYCAAHGLWFHDDPANFDDALARCRVRLRVVPELERLNPSVRLAAARLAGIAGQEDRYLDGIAGAALERCEAPLNGPLAFLTRDLEAAFRRKDLGGMHPVIVRRALRLAAGHLGAELTYDQVHTAADALPCGKPGSITAPAGKVVLEWGCELLHVYRIEAEAPFRHPLTVPGETEAVAAGWRFVAHPAAGGDPMRPPRSLDVVLDQDAAQGGLYFRSLEPGDRMAPLGMTGARKLADLMSEAGLTLAARRRLPILCDSEGPIWVPGVALGERVKVTPASRNRLCVRLEPPA
jgi:tRNA(Ile)-lysidine synthase